MIGKIKAACDATPQPATPSSWPAPMPPAVHGLRRRHGARPAVRRSGGRPAVCRGRDQRQNTSPPCPSGWTPPQLMNMVIGGKTPITSTDGAGQMGYGIVLYANAALQGAVAGDPTCPGRAQSRRPASRKTPTRRPLCRAPAFGKQAHLGCAGEKIPVKFSPTRLYLPRENAHLLAFRPGRLLSFSTPISSAP